GLRLGDAEDATGPVLAGVLIKPGNGDSPGDPTPGDGFVARVTGLPERAFALAILERNGRDRPARQERPGRCAGREVKRSLRSPSASRRPATRQTDGAVARSGGRAIRVPRAGSAAACGAVQRRPA